MLEMDAPRALIFRPLVKGNEALGTRLQVQCKCKCKFSAVRSVSVCPVFKKCIDNNKKRTIKSTGSTFVPVCQTCHLVFLLGKQGWRSGKSARFQPLCPEFDLLYTLKYYIISYSGNGTLFIWSPISQNYCC